MTDDPSPTRPLLLIGRQRVYPRPEAVAPGEAPRDMPRSGEEVIRPGWRNRLAEDSFEFRPLPAGQA